MVPDRGSGGDLDPAVGGIDVHIGRHARDLALGIIYRERQHRAGCEQPEPAIDFLAHVFGGRNEGVPELPQFPIPHRFHQPVALILRQRLQPRMRALEGNRFEKGHSRLRW